MYRCISKECAHDGLINIYETLLELSCTTQNALLHFNSRKNHSLFNPPVLSGHTALKHDIFLPFQFDILLYPDLLVTNTVIVMF